jgi:hypothetical protein
MTQIELGGVTFVVERVTPTYTRLVPIDDPCWLLRAIEQVILRIEDDTVKLHECPTCGAGEDEPCRTRKGRPKSSVHDTRPFSVEAVG